MPIWAQTKHTRYYACGDTRTTTYHLSTSLIVLHSHHAIIELFFLHFIDMNSSLQEPTQSEMKGCHASQQTLLASDILHSSRLGLACLLGQRIMISKPIKPSQPGDWLAPKYNSVSVVQLLWHLQNNSTVTATQGPWRQTRGFSFFLSISRLHSVRSICANGRIFERLTGFLHMDIHRCFVRNLSACTICMCVCVCICVVDYTRKEGNRYYYHSRRCGALCSFLSQAEQLSKPDVVAVALRLVWNYYSRNSMAVLYVSSTVLYSCSVSSSSTSRQTDRQAGRQADREQIKISLLHGMAWHSIA